MAIRSAKLNLLHIAYPTVADSVVNNKFYSALQIYLSVFAPLKLDF